MSPQYLDAGRATYYCGRHRTMARAQSCHNSVSNHTLDTFVTEKLLEALSPAAVELSLRVIEDEVARREQFEKLHVHRVEQARYAANLAERRYKEVDPANRLVAATLEREWEAAMSELQIAKEQFEQLRNSRPTRVSDAQRQELLASCSDIAGLWNSAAIEERKQIARLMLQRVQVHVHNNSDRVGVTLHWSGGFESCYEIIRTVTRFDQMESYQELIDRALALALAGKSTEEISRILAAEGYHAPRTGGGISADMVQKLFGEPSCRSQLDNPQLQPGYWRSSDLAKKLGLPEKRLKAWVTMGRAKAIQRPHGRTWVIFADDRELDRLKQFVR
jgi:hypothetical protein